MALTGVVANKNGVDLVANYPVFLPEIIADDKGIGGPRGFYWFTPASNDGVSVTGFDKTLTPELGTTPPIPSAFKTMLVELDNGEYAYFVVPNNYTLATYNTAKCAGCSPIADVTIPEPILPLYSECSSTVTVSACRYPSREELPALVSGNRYTSLMYCGGVAVNASAITGTTAALLAAALQTKLRAGEGSMAADSVATVTATGNTLLFDTICANFAVVISQEDIP